jgi:SAM-dependent methyltransferase
MMDTLNHIISEIGINNINRIVLSKPKSHSEYSGITGRQLLVKKNLVIQFEKHKNNQVFHENVQMENVPLKIMELFTGSFEIIRLRTKDLEYELAAAGDNQVTVKKTRNILQDDETRLDHNKEKNYLIKENIAFEPLIDLGIFTRDGKISKAKYDKYKQINRFLEIIQDVLKYLPKEKINILDFGCGKSYLTFIVYFFLERICNYEVHIIGLDLKKEVITQCGEIAKKYGYKNLRFETGEIGSFIPPWDIDMVISLHACDTATDDVLFSAVKNNARVILSVPCCQHELNKQIQNDDLAILTKYGIIKERVAALYTDAVRANLLEAAGYKTQVLEFIDIDNTPKNMLIRAVKSRIPEHIKNRALKEVTNLIQMFSLSPKLYKMLVDNGFV